MGARSHVQEVRPACLLRETGSAVPLPLGDGNPLASSRPGVLPTNPPYELSFADHARLHLVSYGAIFWLERQPVVQVEAVQASGSNSPLPLTPVMSKSLPA